MGSKVVFHSLLEFAQRTKTSDQLMGDRDFNGTRQDPLCFYGSDLPEFSGRDNSSHTANIQSDAVIENYDHWNARDKSEPLQKQVDDFTQHFPQEITELGITSNEVVTIVGRLCKGATELMNS